MKDTAEIPVQPSLRADGIPNINIGQSYDQHYTDAEIHYENLENLAAFFGRNMPVHYHDRFYQLHVILNGIVRVHLDEQSYTAEGPVFFLTPPAVPHAFVTENAAKGHVLTIRQQQVWNLLGGMEQSLWGSNSAISHPLCVALEPEYSPIAARFLRLLELIGEEYDQTEIQRNRALQALLQLILIDICRLADQEQPQQNVRKEDVRIFHTFNGLIEQHYREHLTLSQYAGKIGVTEARLNDICQRLAGLASKRLVMDRIMQEARRFLLFTTMGVTEISYELGFKDPAYFARFFRRHSGMTASQYRKEHRR
ncbi:4-hydroxyphenylacetate catabolism regulatory protein HpaA [Oceanospirillum sediminis]|uniref:4-hydroxyphenylacetate catabolism regulatory protein HpaA n=1 Tax=Oceanospirillum sediminis TaxID=2760088 RepID=A0A839IVV4_9GAMM|nr:4-hydroxyphenylacetate catabolism regulatory protein HpaA [Oceanospirillum sediminis]MBB1489563.1 4-hydroxyphenylacetate catabolism regulatory protein HpaA [Oceanospirillum sediminis]